MNRRLFRTAVFVFILFALNFAIGMFLERPKQILIKNQKFDPFWRWKEFYEQPAHSVDLVFLGSSHCYRSFNPKIFDDALKIESFNMGSSSQTPITSYFVLKEILKTQKPKYVVLEIYWRTFTNDEQFTNATYNLEYMRDGRNKIEFLRYGYQPKDLINFLFPAYRYRNNLQDAIRSLMGKTVASEPGDEYGGKGFVANPTVVSKKKLTEHNLFKDYFFDPKELKAKNLEYLEKIIRLCKDQGIQLVFVTSPLPPTSLDLIRNYSDIYDYFLKIAEQNKILYLDYNVLEERRLFFDADFKDDNHLNVKGVVKLSTDLAGKLSPGIFLRP